VPRSRFAGQDEEHLISDVTLRNITILGEPIRDLKALRLSLNEYCDSIVIE